MRTGISTACLYPMLLEDSLKSLISLNFRTFEIFINTCSELKDSYLKNLKKIAVENESVIESVRPFTSGFESFLLFSDYKRRFFDGLEFYKKYFNACNVFGAHILVLHGRRSDKISITDNEYFERYLKLYELGKTFGVTVAQENVNLFSSNNPEFIRKMRKACGENCAFVLDIKQAVRGGFDPYRFCTAMGGQVIHVHINDNNLSSDCLLPGFGNMDYQKLVQMLKSFGFDGILTIEVYRKSFGGLSELLTAQKTINAFL